MKSCEHCGKEFDPKRDYRKRFCNRSCAASYLNPQRKLKPRVLCIKCKTPMLQRKGQVYCSNTCKGTKLDKWLEGSWDGTVKVGLSRAVRLYLIKEANYKCEKCGWGEINPVTKVVPLTIDHKDGNCLNNARNNLQVLCPNCHSLTPTYCGLNRGKTTRHRYK